MTGSLGDWVRVVHRVLTFFNCAELASTCLQLHPGLALMCLEKSRSFGTENAWGTIMRGAGHMTAEACQLQWPGLSGGTILGRE